MKSQLSALEIHYIVEELQELVGGKVDKIYNPKKKEILLQLHVPSKGKKVLRVVVPSFCYLTDKKGFAQDPTGFCMFLRKYLNNTRLISIDQIRSERVIKLAFEGREGIKILYLEFFLKGNIILCDGDVIISPEENQIWADRVIKGREKYEVPVKDIDLFKITEDGFKDMLHNTLQKSLVKAIAIELALGGVYAEEVCILSQVDKTENPRNIKGEILKLVWNNVKIIRNMKIEPKVVFSKGDIKDIVPFELKFYDKFEVKTAETYNLALDTYLPRDDLIVGPSKYQSQMEKADNIIEQQQKTIEKLEDKEQEAKESAAAIYANYKLIEEVLPVLQNAIKKYSSKEIMVKLKGHKVIKEFNAKEKFVIMELKND